MLKRERNELAPIHTLPVELLVAIFDTAIKNGNNRSELGGGGGRRAQGPVVLSQVASHWRNIVTESPSLWTTVELGYRGVKLALQRSKDLPLHIRGPNPQTSGPDIYSLLQLVKPHSHRWKSFDWEASFDILNPAFLTLTTPILVTLNLRLPPSFNYFMNVPSPASPRLRELRLSGVVLPWIPQTLPSLQLFWLSKLGEDGVPDPGSLVAFLASCPALQEIRFQELGRDREADDPPINSPSPPEIFNLPSLKTLVFDDVMETFVAGVLNVVLADSLTRFTVDTTKFRDNNLVPEIILTALAGQPGRDSLIQTVCRNTTEAEVSLVIESWAIQLMHPEDEDDAERRDGVNIVIPGTQWTNRMGEVLESFRLDSIGTPLKLSLCQREEDDDVFEDIYIEFLKRLPGIISITISHEFDINWILWHLSKRRKGEPWLCPNLAEVRLTALNVPDEEVGEVLKAVRILAKRRPEVLIVDDAGNVYHPGITYFMDLYLE